MMLQETRSSHAERHAEKRVNRVEAREVDHRGGNENQNASDKGLHDVPEGAAHIEVAFLAAG